MDKDVIIALIGASATVVAALIGLVAVQRGSGRTAVPAEPRPAVQPLPRRRLRPSKNTKTVALVLVVVVALTGLIVVVLSKENLAGCRSYVPLAVTSSTEKDELLGDLALEYARSGVAHNGVCAQVTVTGVSSGDALEGLAQGWGSTDYTAGKTRPQVWTPTSDMWVRLYEQQLKTTVAATSITRSQLVIALPKSNALALGWPDKPLSWNHLRDLVVSPTPWQQVPALPAGQPFTIGKDNPKYSTSGLAATVAAYHAGNRHLRGSSDLAAAVADDAVTNYVRSMESGTTYTHDVMDLLTNLGRHDAMGDALKYLSGTIMQEELVYLYNSRDSEVFHDDIPESLREPLHVFFPSDGLFELNHPYVVLDEDEAVRDAAESFRLFLIDEPQQQRFMATGFRHLRTNDLAPQARAVMNIPPGSPPRYAAPVQAEPLTRILADIDKLRRKARVLLVIDVSGSMDDEVNGPKSKLDLVKDAVEAAIGQLNPHDEVGLMVFSSKGRQAGSLPYTMLVDVAPLATVSDQLIAKLRKVEPGGDTSLYDSVRAAVDKMAVRRTSDWVNAVVVLSDGRDTGYPGDEARALKNLTANLQQRELKVPIYTIGFGLNTSRGFTCDPPPNEDAELRVAREALQQISTTTYGSCFNASATSASFINKVFVDVFRHF